MHIPPSGDDGVSFNGVGGGEPCEREIIRGVGEVENFTKGEIFEGLGEVVATVEICNWLGEVELFTITHKWLGKVVIIPSINMRLEKVEISATLDKWLEEVTMTQLVLIVVVLAEHCVVF